MMGGWGGWSGDLFPLKEKVAILAILIVNRLKQALKLSRMTGSFKTRNIIVVVSTMPAIPASS